MFRRKRVHCLTESPLLQLPNDTISHILSFLPSKETSRAVRVCKTFQEAVSVDNKFWYERGVVDFVNNPNLKSMNHIIHPVFKNPFEHYNSEEPVYKNYCKTANEIFLHEKKINNAIRRQKLLYRNGVAVNCLSKIGDCVVRFFSFLLILLFEILLPLRLDNWLHFPYYIILLPIWVLFGIHFVYANSWMFVWCLRGISFDPQYSPKFFATRRTLMINIALICLLVFTCICSMTGDGILPKFSAIYFLPLFILLFLFSVWVIIVCAIDIYLYKLYRAILFAIYAAWFVIPITLFLVLVSIKIDYPEIGMSWYITLIPLLALKICTSGCALCDTLCVTTVCVDLFGISEDYEFPSATGYVLSYFYNEYSTGKQKDGYSIEKPKITGLGCCSSALCFLFFFLSCFSVAVSELMICDTLSKDYATTFTVSFIPLWIFTIIGGMCIWAAPMCMHAGLVLIDVIRQS
jgi:hypothetical protein